MKLIDSSLRPRTPEDRQIDLVSTSRNTANASPVILNQTDMLQLKFEPTLVDNTNEPEKSVSGKLIYEKKHKRDSEYPSKITRQSVKVGEFIEVNLSTTETFNLYRGLTELYELHADIRHTPNGSSSFLRVDRRIKQLQTLLHDDPSIVGMLDREDVLDLVKLLFSLISQSSSIAAVREGLEKLELTAVSSLSNIISTTRLESMLTVLEENLNNSSEEFWQKTFDDNQWILSQIFSCPYTIFEEKAYVGGKGISNSGGNVCDFIYQNNLTNNIALVEIKTPCALLFGSPYRSTYSFSSELSGAINQVLNYRDNLSKEYYSTYRNSQMDFEVFSPKCYIVIGKIRGLNRAQIAALENYRNTLTNVAVITFDELIQRIKDMISLLEEKDPAEQMGKSAYDENIPF